jgi:transcriptional regulator with XRE-family HTH domain
MMVPHPSLVSETLDSGYPVDLPKSREVVQCKSCGLVQYRTKKDVCRRCLRVLPSKSNFLLPPAERQPTANDNYQLKEISPNLHVVKKIGERVKLLRESRNLTQGRLQAASKVSRSYLSRIESGQMTPGLRTLEKLSGALGVDLNSFFVPISNGEALLSDPYMQKLQPFFQKLHWEQWQFILKRLAAIHNHEVAKYKRSALTREPRSLRNDRMTRRPRASDRHKQSVAG